MFLIQALDNLKSRGLTPTALWHFAGDCLAESRAHLRARPRHATRIAWFVSLTNIPLVFVVAVVYLPMGADVFFRVTAATLGASALALFVVLLSLGLVRDKDGRPAPRFGIANRLTVLRFLLVVPTAAFILAGRYDVALPVYMVCVMTDLFDGMVARRRHEQTVFGTAMDPLADIVSTAGVFAALLIVDLVPAWVFGVLIARYAMFFAGIAVMFLAIGPMKLAATPVGKVVAVLQAFVVIIILTMASLNITWHDNVVDGINLFLGLLFSSVIVSQFALGILHVSRGAVNARS